MLQKLQGFKYATALDLNMDYYTMRMDPNASIISTIILHWCNYSYQRLPMCISGLTDIFQEKMSGLIGELKFVRMYLDELLLLAKDSFADL